MNKILTDGELARYFNVKFFCYVAFLVISLYLEWHYGDKNDRNKSEGDTEEADWKRIFEYGLNKEDTQ